MTITDAQRWAIAQFCGWRMLPCDDPKCDACMSNVGKQFSRLVDEQGNGVSRTSFMDGWSFESMDERVDLLPRYESDPRHVGPMLMAMRKRGRSPCLAESRIGGQWVCSTDRYIGTGDTMNEACCLAILQIIESGAKPQGDER